MREITGAVIERSGSPVVIETLALADPRPGEMLIRMTAAGVRFAGTPRTEPYGRVVVFLDIAGNKWDLLGPAA